MNKAIMIIAKICEVGHWIAVGFFTVFVIALGIGKDELIYQLSDLNATSSEIDVNGLTMEAAEGPFSVSAYMIFFIAAIVICVLTALVFRNLHAAFKTAEGKTKYSEGKTPFQPAVVKKIKNMGYLCISIPVVQLIFSIIINAMGVGAETSVGMTGIFLGLIVLALSRFFAYGVELQNDVEGLV